jgi:hypothetical protein
MRSGCRSTEPIVGLIIRQARTKITWNRLAHAAARPLCHVSAHGFGNDCVHAGFGNVVGILFCGSRRAARTIVDGHQKARSTVIAIKSYVTLAFSPANAAIRARVYLDPNSDCRPASPHTVGVDESFPIVESVPTSSN